MTEIGIKYKVNLEHAGMDLNLISNACEYAYQKAFDYLKTVVNCGARWNLFGAKRFTYKLDHTVLATLASKDNLEIAQLNRDRKNYHKSTKPYLVRI